MTIIRPLLAAVSAIPLLSATASAVIVVNTDFTSSLTGFGFDTVELPSTAGYSTAGPGGSRAIGLIDPSDTLSSIARLNFGNAAIPAFNTALAGQSELQVRFDIAVTTMVTSSGSNSLPRVLIRPTDTAEGLTIAFGRSTTGELLLFARKGNNQPPGAGMLSYSFGTYDTTTAANNNTGGYVTISISLLHGGTTASVSATQGSTTLFSGNLTGFAGHAFSNSSMDFVPATGAGGLSELFVDNLFIQTVPEPTTALLGSLAALGLFRRRR